MKNVFSKKNVIQLEILEHSVATRQKNMYIFVQRLQSKLRCDCYCIVQGTSLKSQRGHLFKLNTLNLNRKHNFSIRV